jgi:hypothetical protein
VQRRKGSCDEQQLLHGCCHEDVDEDNHKNTSVEEDDNRPQSDLLFFNLRSILVEQVHDNVLNVNKTIVET